MLEKVENMITDCEEMVDWESELQKKIVNNQKQIKDSQKIINNITYNINGINSSEGHVIIGNNTRDNTDLSYNINNEYNGESSRNRRIIEEEEEEVVTRIEIPQQRYFAF